MNRSPVKIDELGLTPITVSVLRKNGIETFDDLLLLDDASIKGLDGLSRHRAVKVCECIKKWRNVFDANEARLCQDFSSGLNETIVYDSIGLYLKDQGVWNRNIEIFASYYRTPKLTLDEIALERKITRERVRQICGRCLNIVAKGFRNNVINHTILEKIEEAAEKKTEISMVDVSDGLLGREGLIRVVVAIYNKEFKIVSSQKWNGKWLVRKDENIKTMIDYLSKTLQERDTPMSIKDVLSIFPINEDMLLSIKNIVEKDGYVTLSTNKMVTGRIPRIKNYLAKVNRPSSIQEISENTGLTLNQVRGAVTDKNEFENVGKSVYDSVDANYIDLSPSEMAKNILLAENRAISVQQIIKYVKKYDYSDLSDRDILIDLFSRSEPIVYHMDGYVLLKEWGPEKIQKPERRGYTIELKEAIRTVIPRMEYIFDAEQILEEVKKEFGNDTSNSLNSVKGYLNSLVKDNVIVEVGKNTGCYRRP